MKERHEIDDLFRDKLEGFSLEAPMHLWNNIAEQDLKPSSKGRKKGFFFLWLFAALLVSGAGLAYFVQFSAAKTPETLNHFPIQLPASSNSLEKQVIPDNEFDSEAVNASTPIASSSLGKENNAQDLQALSNFPGENKQHSFEKAIETPQADKNIASSSPPAFDSNAEVPVFNKSEEEEELALNGSEKELAEKQLELNAFMLSPLKKGLLLVDNPIGDEKLFSPNFSKKPWLTTLDFMASMDYVMRQVEAKEQEFDAYAKLRKDTEIFRHGVSFGMRLSTVSESGFAVRSGLNFSQINEQLNFKIKEEEKLTITTRYDVDGSIIGQDTSVALVGTYRIVNNRYSELDIPLLVGFERGGEKVALSLNGGFLINMLSAQKGEFVSPNTNNPVAFSSNDENSYRAFRNRLGIGFYGSAGFYFQFKDNMQVLLEPYVKYRPGSITVDAYVVDQRYLTAGLFVGLRKRIL